MIELANEWKIQLGLPFLNEGQLHRAKITSSGEQWNWAPNEKVVDDLPNIEEKARPAPVCHFEAVETFEIYCVPGEGHHEKQSQYRTLAEDWKCV